LEKKIVIYLRRIAIEVGYLDLNTYLSFFPVRVIFFSGFIGPGWLV